MQAQVVRASVVGGGLVPEDGSQQGTEQLQHSWRFITCVCMCVHDIKVCLLCVRMYVRMYVCIYV